MQKPRSAGSFDVSLGHRLRERRIELGLSQERVADFIGVSFQQLQKYEKGVNRISAATLFELAKVLEVDPAVMMSRGKGAPPSEPAQGVATSAPHEVALLVTSFLEIDTQETRRAVLTLVQQLAECASRSKAVRVRA